MLEISIQSRRRTELIEISSRVEEAVRRLGRHDGSVTVYVPHTTAGILINENADPDVAADIEAALDRLVPWHGPYRHGEGNAAAHVKASLVGSSVRVLVRDGKLALGTWQGIFFCEFDGPRRRRVWIA
ncbi:MAG TPA: YjbQ family protein [Kiritimatiellae bacterium]|nr:YjbQ family protein [Kiritimatiellia bacterium]